MQFIYDFLLWLKSYVDKPALYGPYHIAWIIGLVVLCIVYGLISKKAKNENFFKRTILVCWILLIILEALKEISGSFSMNNGIPTFNYPMSYFPFQLCSLPFYILPFIIFIKNYKVRQYFVAPTVTYILLGGVLFFLIPGSYCNVLYINFHTMAHHGLQFFTSFVCILWFNKELSFKHFLKALPVMFVTFGLALFFNDHLFKATGKYIQLWNLSNHFNLEMDLLQNIKNAIGYPLYLVLYLVTLIAFSFIIYMIPLGIKLIKDKKHKN